MTLHTPDPRFTRRSTLALACALTALLSACGGGGGGGSPAANDSAPTLVITTANRDTVAQAAAASVVGLSAGTSSVPLASTDGDRQVLTAPPTSSASTIGGRSALLPAALRLQLLAWLHTRTRQSLFDNASRKRALAVTGPITTPCSLGGSGTVTVDDRDNSSTPSTGDTMTLLFNACEETAGETLSGQINLTLTQASTGTAYPQQFAARLALNQLTVSHGSRSLRSDGTALMTVVSDSSVLDRYTVTVEDPLVTTLTGGANPDTVTMLAGYTEQSVYNASIAPPDGGLAGRSTTTVTGNVRSTRAGGQFALSTSTSLVQYDVDSYPRAGVLMARGSSGNLRMTVLSARQLQLETDAVGNGQYEHSTTVAWTTLL